MDASTDQGDPTTGELLGLDDYGTLDFVSKLRIVDKIIETCSVEELYVMLANVNSRFPLGAAPVKTDLLTMNAWKSLEPRLNSMSISHALKIVLMQLGYIHANGTKLAEQIFDTIGTMVSNSTSKMNPDQVKESLSILRLIIQAARYHQAFTDNTITKLVSKVEWSVDTRHHTDRYVVSIKKIAVQPDSRKKGYVFKFTVVWNDANEDICLRSHNELFDFQCKLLDLFPEQAKASATGERQIPYLPGKKLLVSGFKTDKAMAKSRMPGVQDYLDKLICLPVEISRCSHVTDFFISCQVCNYIINDIDQCDNEGCPQHSRLQKRCNTLDKIASPSSPSPLSSSPDSAPVAEPPLPPDPIEENGPMPNEPVTYMVHGSDGSVMPIEGTVVPIGTPYTWAPAPMHPGQMQGVSAEFVPQPYFDPHSAFAPSMYPAYPLGSMVPGMAPYPTPYPNHMDKPRRNKSRSKSQSENNGQISRSRSGSGTNRHGSHRSNGGSKSGSVSSIDLLDDVPTLHRKGSGKLVVRSSSYRDSRLSWTGSQSSISSAVDDKFGLHGAGAPRGSTQSLQEALADPPSETSTDMMTKSLSVSTQNLTEKAVKGLGNHPSLNERRQSLSESVHSLDSVVSSMSTRSVASSVADSEGGQQRKKILMCILCGKENVDTWQCLPCEVKLTPDEMIKLLQEFNCTIDNAESLDSEEKTQQLILYVRRVMWLKSIRMHKYSQVLMGESKNWLLNATDAVFSELGLTSGARKKLLAKVAEPTLDWPMPPGQ